MNSNMLSNVFLFDYRLLSCMYEKDMQQLPMLIYQILMNWVLINFRIANFSSGILDRSFTRF